MPSVTTKALLEVRINAMLSASVPATHWVAGALDEALTTTLEEYSRAKPYTGVSTILAGAGLREVSLAGFPRAVLAVNKVWFPYTAGSPEYPPAWVDFDLWFDSGVPTLLLYGPVAGDGFKVARVWYQSLHTLNGLAGATVTTWLAADDSAMVVGACGYACLQRSTELDETLNNMAISTPNYGALAGIFLDRFHVMLYGSALPALPLGPDGTAP